MQCLGLWVVNRIWARFAVHMDLNVPILCKKTFACKRKKKGQGNSTQLIFTACPSFQNSAQEHLYKSAICDVTKGTEVFNFYCFPSVKKKKSISPTGIHSHFSLKRCEITSILFYLILDNYLDKAAALEFTLKDKNCSFFKI